MPCIGEEESFFIVLDLCGGRCYHMKRSGSTYYRERGVIWEEFIQTTKNMNLRV